MGVTAASKFRGVVRISLPGFVNFCAARTAVPAAEATEAYKTSVLRGIDPLFLLAKFWHESQGGKEGWAKRTKSWGNTRPPNFGSREVGAYQQDTGKFTDYPGPYQPRSLCAYATWLDGADSTLARLNAPAHPPGGAYAFRTEIQEVYVHPSNQVWAPAGDFNNPKGYLRAVVDFMNKYSDMETPMGRNVVEIPAIIPWGRRNRDGRKLQKVQHITVHNTDNPREGADAIMHRNYVLGPEAGGGASYHAVADDKRVIQLLPYDEVAYHIGDGADEPARDPAFFGLGIEVCEHAGIHFPTAARLAAGWVADRLNEAGLPFIPNVTVVKHGFWYSPQRPHVHQYCPARFNAGWQGVTWDLFLLMVKNRMGKVSSAPPVPPHEAPVNLNSFVLKGWFRVLYEQLGDKALLVVGLPVANERQADVPGFGMTTVQDFERTTFILNPDGAPGWGVTAATVEQLRALRG